MHHDDPGKNDRPALHDPQRRQASDDSYAEPPSSQERTSGQRPHGDTNGQDPAEYGYGEANPHGAQYEQGGKYPGTRTVGDPYYHHDAPRSEAVRASAEGQGVSPVDPSVPYTDSTSSVRTDDYIRGALCERLRDSGLEVGDVQVSVQNAKAILTGNVPDHETRVAVEDCANACAGVEEVENRVQVFSGGGYAAGPV
jgi:osmotically-inducible protein OsmY